MTQATRLKEQGEVMSIERGQHFELVVREYLESRGLQFLARNVRYRFGELDLVMRDHDELVFVEVRARQSNQFGPALASVDARKRKRLRFAAQRYLMQFCSRVPRCRFDLVTFEGGEIGWIPNAFDAQD